MSASTHLSPPPGQDCPGSPVHFIALAEATPQPWRNGGGVTRELLAWAPASPPAPQDWTVRVSVADITRDGPFSAFAGVERGFTVLEGAGVVLTLDGRTFPLTPGDDPLRFDGAAAPGCRLLDGPTRDLNLMVRHASGRAGMARAEPAAPRACAGPWRGLYVHGSAVVDFGHGPQTLVSAGLAWSGQPVHAASGGASSAQTATWTLIRGGPAWWLWMDALEEPR